MAQWRNIDYKYSYLEKDAASETREYAPNSFFGELLQQANSPFFHQHY